MRPLIFWRLILVRRFVQWVTDPNEVLDAYWQYWLAQYPEQSVLVEQARELILALRHDVADLASEERAQLHQRIRQSIHTDPPSPLARPKTRRLQSQTVLGRPWRWAASVAAVLALVVGLLWWQQRRVEYATGYGETQQVILPDGSSVTLNANSMLTYAASQPRELWLQGEAYFSVQRMEHHREQQEYGKQFVVHTDQLDVEVLGTAFNVNSRRGDAQE